MTPETKQIFTLLLSKFQANNNLKNNTQRPRKKRSVNVDIDAKGHNQLKTEGCLLSVFYL